MVIAVICGGGNGAHVCAGITSSQPGVEARVLTLFADEAERWANATKDHDFTVTLHAANKDPVKLVSKPSMVTKDPAEAMRGNVDIIVFTVPAFAHKNYLEQLKPYVKPGMILAGCPGQAGFEFAVRGIWGELALKVSVMSFESLPWACRVLEFGRAAEVLGTKATLVGAVTECTPKPSSDPTATLQKVLGDAPKLVVKGHLLGITLMGTNGYLHPSIMYGTWHKWDGKPLKEVPVFYNGLDEFSAKLLSDISDEVVATAKAIMKQRPQVDLNNVSHILQWYHRCYADDIEDKGSLYTCIKTNRAYKGLPHPMTKRDDGSYVPNFGYRYLTEDIPFGLVVMRGIATIAGVPTPNIDTIINWAQKLLGKEYLVDGELKGKDLPESRCPQRYGLASLDTILGLA
ncbi:hypothetical protein LSH36_604g04078 [Paralvinella palmiformis]|uniref:Opine dehydrogenase domain-containing protein n=1 Tax=Paralvinella palmiformis TaxID=53620 RepID=A0AAD9J5Z7_9ANNE|nr:hypothetical protein LSH36_604g04078 [Paralvinella palmiformis]